QQLIREAPAGCTLDARAGATVLPVWPPLVEFPLLDQTSDAAATLTFKANLRPSATAEFCRQADALPIRPLLHAQAGNGIVTGHLLLPRAGAADMLQKLRDLAAPSGGSVVVLGCPPAWKADFAVWGPPRGNAWLMRRIKEALDPRDLFNPGRFVVSSP